MTSFLKVKFSVYAFNTEQKQVTCWLVKPENIKWNNLAAKRLAQIKAMWQNNSFVILFVKEIDGMI